jgi:aspartate-semialdehyde dehydrogenase
MTRKFDVAVVGATGAVGEAMLEILAERDFPVNNVYPLASARSAGKKVAFGNRQLTVQELDSFDFSKVQIGLFSAGASVSAEYAPKAAAAGCVVIDNTSQYRYDDDIPLVVPEVNPEAIGHYTNRGIIANPNCSTIQMLVALKPLHDAAGIERINVCTYQAVSGTGKEAIEELATQTAQLLNAKEAVCEVYPKQIAFNVLPHIDVFQDNGYTKEEMKMVWETRKIMGDVVLDERVDGGYPPAVTEGANNDPVYVGRIREDISHPRGLDLWVVADNVRKGAALNSIQIAEVLVKDYL